MNAILGVFYHAVGGFASGSFYLPFRNVKQWSWESAWIVGGVASWIIVPWVMGSITVHGLVPSITSADSNTLFWTYFFGVLWGIGGLTFGLTMRYLGISLGMAVALGYCSAFGTLVPPIWDGKIDMLLYTSTGHYTLGGVALCLVGIAVCGWAGVLKERELNPAQQKATVAEFNLKKGIIVATISGILSACFAFALTAGKPIAKMAVTNGTDPLWQNNAIYPVLMFGGFTTNFIWCMILNRRNRSFGDYTDSQTPLLRNYIWAMLAGTTWYFQFFFYGMGDNYLPDGIRFAGWTMHMAFIITFSTLWGLVLWEWRGASRRTYSVVFAGLLLIVLSTVLIGLGTQA
ncbi:L-rhamnose/proton symporter RhaT [Spirosoma aureum]|uniref:L-rhamnose/proton symporter RhaT n=1 Tax=Spirosoma aureum TaxID=2692134 RepID=A0A6G9AIK8_9BACT|nr:L-rhamnose/proton symporter RhaT [Spirosoma aureum]QIP12301.1 L-rhamnose/proton symporter RhaT [Spirosoma aureum]